MFDIKGIRFYICLSQNPQKCSARLRLLMYVHFNFLFRFKRSHISYPSNRTILFGLHFIDAISVLWTVYFLDMTSSLTVLIIIIMSGSALAVTCLFLRKGHQSAVKHSIQWCLLCTVCVGCWVTCTVDSVI